MISCSLISTFRAMMNALTEFFLPRVSIALWADLRSVFVVNFLKIFATLPTYPRKQISELTKSPVKHLLAKKPFCRNPKINIFDKNQICLVAQEMRGRANICYTNDNKFPTIQASVLVGFLLDRFGTGNS